MEVAPKDEGPKTMEESLGTQERNLLRRVLNRISRRAGSSTGAGKENWERVAIKVKEEFPCQDRTKYTYATGRFTTWLKTEELSGMHWPATA